MGATPPSPVSALLLVLGRVDQVPVLARLRRRGQRLPLDRRDLTRAGVRLVLPAHGRGRSRLVLLGHDLASYQPLRAVRTRTRRAKRRHRDETRCRFTSYRQASREPRSVVRPPSDFERGSFTWQGTERITSVKVGLWIALWTTWGKAQDPLWIPWGPSVGSEAR